jgi:uncharacterized protein YidB (DUF937 family)
MFDPHQGPIVFAVVNNVQITLRGHKARTMRLIHEVIENLRVSAPDEAITPMSAALLKLLGGERGSLPELAERFTEAGLGPVMASWIGNGPNLPIRPSDLRSVLGEERAQDLATLAGLPSGEFLVHLARLLPAAVHRMTPGGVADDSPVSRRSKRGQPDNRTTVSMPRRNDMSNDMVIDLSVSALAAEREARHLRELETERQLKQKEQERLADFKQRLDSFQVSDELRRTIVDRIKRAFDQGETELMFVSFPSSFCTDNGRAILNAGEPPINRTDEDKQKAADQEPEWLATLPNGLRPIYGLWKQHLKAGGFHLSARVINFPGGKPGDVGLFFSWPKT